MNNADMKAGRYLRWHKARVKVAAIKAALASGAVVMIATYTKATQYDKRHGEMFKATRSGAWVQRGKHWDCIDGAGIKVYHEKVKA